MPAERLAVVPDTRHDSLHASHAAAMTLIPGVTETIFNIPGMGQYLVGGLQTNDLPIVQIWMLIFGTVLVLTNLVVDLSYTWLDPRVKLK